MGGLKQLQEDILLTNRVALITGGGRGIGAEIVRRFGHEANRVCLYFPGYPITDECIAETIREIKVASGEV